MTSKQLLEKMDKLIEKLRGKIEAEDIIFDEDLTIFNTTKKNERNGGGNDNDLRK